MLCNSAFVAVSATELSVDLRSNPQLIRFTCTGSMPSQLNNPESLNTQVRAHELNSWSEK